MTISDIKRKNVMIIGSALVRTHHQVRPITAQLIITLLEIERLTILNHSEEVTTKQIYENLNRTRQWMTAQYISLTNNGFIKQTGRNSVILTHKGKKIISQFWENYGVMVKNIKNNSK